MMDEVRADPLVQKLLEKFPGAEIVSVRDRQAVADAEADALPLDQDPATDESEDKD